MVVFLGVVMGWGAALESVAILKTPLVNHQSLGRALALGA